MVVVMGEDTDYALLFGGEVTGGDVGKLFDFFSEFGVVFHTVEVLEFFIFEQILVFIDLFIVFEKGLVFEGQDEFILEFL